MIGRRAVIGLSLLSALVFCAFAAQSASAVTTSENTTAVTCVEEPKKLGDFEDEHCDNTNIGKGGFTHAAIKNGVVTEIHGTNEKVTNETKDSEPAELKGTVALVKTEIICSEVTADPKGSTFENSEPKVGKHTVKGVALVTYKKCTVLKPAKCTVQETIEAEATVHGVEGLEGPKGEKNAMGLEFIGKGEKEKFTSITFKGAECALKEKTFNVEGKVYATNGTGTEAAQENKHTGATLVFTPKFKMQELKFGGATAEFNSIMTVRMAEVTPEKTEPPISLTTTP
jgi:hypothetical protein